MTDDYETGNVASTERQLREARATICRDRSRAATVGGLVRRITNGDADLETFRTIYRVLKEIGT